MLSTKLKIKNASNTQQNKPYNPPPPSTTKQNNRKNVVIKTKLALELSIVYNTRHLPSTTSSTRSATLARSTMAQRSSGHSWKVIRRLFPVTTVMGPLDCLRLWPVSFFFRCQDQESSTNVHVFCCCFVFSKRVCFFRPLVRPAFFFLPLHLFHDFMLSMVCRWTWHRLLRRSSVEL